MSKINYFILLSLLIGISFHAYSQRYITITGKVVDADTGEPIVFASIGIKDKSIGTITNAIGEFDFHIPSEYSQGIFVINMLGYESFYLSIEEIISKNITEFSLIKSTQLMEEVIIKDSLSGGDVLRIALQKIEDNYPVQPFMMDGFYRDLKRVGGTYIALLEAAVKIYDRDYYVPKNPFRLKERVALVEVRKSLGYENKFTTFFDQTNLLEDLLLHNNIKYRQFPSISSSFFSHLTRKKIDIYNGKKVFVLAINRDIKMELIVDANTFAIIRLEYESGAQPDIILRKDGLISRYSNLKKIIEFKEYAGRLYLNHMDLISNIDWYDEQTGEIKFETSLHQQLMINKVFVQTTQKIGTTEKMKRFGLQHQKRKYNKEFWDNYNLIKETPLDKKIVEDLEKDLSLEKQFADN